MYKWTNFIKNISKVSYWLQLGKNDILDILITIKSTHSLVNTILTYSTLNKVYEQ